MTEPEVVYFSYNLIYAQFIENKIITKRTPHVQWVLELSMFCLFKLNYNYMLY